MWNLISDISVFKFLLFGEGQSRKNLAQFSSFSFSFESEENRRKKLDGLKFALNCCVISGVRENPVVGGKDKICVRFLSFVMIWLFNLFFIIYLSCVGCLVKQFPSYSLPLHHSFPTTGGLLFVRHLLFGSFSLARMGSHALVTEVGIVGIVFREKESYFPDRSFIIAGHRNIIHKYFSSKSSQSPFGF